jgi:hypothetical protein
MSELDFLKQVQSKVEEALGKTKKNLDALEIPQPLRNNKFLEEFDRKCGTANSKEERDNEMNDFKEHHEGTGQFLDFWDYQLARQLKLFESLRDEEIKIKEKKLKEKRRLESKLKILEDNKKRLKKEIRRLKTP